MKNYSIRTNNSNNNTNIINNNNKSIPYTAIGTIVGVIIIIFTIYWLIQSNISSTTTTTTSTITDSGSMDFNDISFNHGGVGDASTVQHYIGMLYIGPNHIVNTVNSNTARINTGSATSVLNHSDLPLGTRVLGPNSIATMDYRPNRLNIHIDSNGIVQRVNYG